MIPTNFMYLRKSRAEEGQSTEEVLAKHRAALEELADRLGLPVDGVYEEVASGEKLYARPEMLKLLERIRAGEVEAVLCMDIDRLGRGGMADQGTILDAFRESGTLIITPEKTYDLTNDVDIEMTEFKAFFARAEWRAIRKRMRRGLMQTIEAGGYTANAPYGYRRCRIGKLPSLEVIPEEARFVRYIYERYLAGIGAQTIAQELNAMGSCPRRGAEWNRNTVRHVLRNPTFAGKVAWNRVKHYRPGAHGKDKHHVVYTPEGEWLMVDGVHEAIIPWDTWLEAQERRKQRYIPPSNTGQRANPFAGIIRCSKCGNNMQRMGTNKGEPYLLCTTKGCTAGAKFEYVEERMVELLYDELARLRLLIDSGASPNVDALEAALAAAQREQERVQARIPRLYEFLEDGTYDRSTFRSRLEAAEKELAELANKRADLERHIDERRRSDPRKAAAALENLVQLYPTMSPADKNSALKALGVEVTYTKEKKTKPRDFTLELQLRDF